jgi:dimeric dUTPase (all-alpha-NTP-PPase superfamily)
MNIKELLDKQKELDTVILERARMRGYPLLEIKLALLTELGELANEVQSFKYWKQHKNVNREKVLEEWADCFHFALSLENYLNQVEDEMLVDLANSIAEILSRKYKKPYINGEFELAYRNVLTEEDILLTIIGLGLDLNISLVEMEKAYLDKNKVNHTRQEKGY